MIKVGRWLGYAGAAIILAAIFWLGHVSIDLFIAAPATVRLGVLTAAVSVLTFVFNNSRQQTREINSRQFSDKREAYQKFFDFLFEIFSAQKKGIEHSDDDLIERMHNITKGLMVWGSARTINQYNQFMRNAINPPENPLDQFRNVESLLKAFRQDLGHDDRKLEAFGLSKLILKADEHDKLKS
ncbi:hypothetical protein [Sphingomonas sp. PP-F2F-G114-C0414]|uniref:hypothetical protein n=1 Tax=Sphingomonas sp. PP-F2F-G114-C0414 TaxID=2135662 RepID=UPI0011C4686A|nr:hypothetical protein [Sphingomonas sp. PP-F2F-G114-C0414]